MRLHIDHAASRDCSWRGDCKIHGLKDHIHIFSHLNDFTGHKAELFIIIKHSVHVLDPNSIDGAIKYQPSSVLFVHLCSKNTIPHGQDTVRPIVRDLIEVTVELTHRNGLGVNDLHVSFHLFHQAFLAELS